ncbi:uncharacterized protein LOC131613333 [Vicia villosa]|uniref:uncharacterized protein LOC131613333 n=1 Tax=Vicia villosa TaxID=3911 RepID=UPI00273B7D98|nr:uncharacterized protein LOC131613333 [Vicia villosa]
MDAGSGMLVQDPTRGGHTLDDIYQARQVAVDAPTESSSRSRSLTGTARLLSGEALLHNLISQFSIMAQVVDFKCPRTGIILTGIAPPESGFDFYSRYFSPKFGINEDPVCGSAHCGLGPYWSKKLGKFDLRAYQKNQIERYKENLGIYID